MSPLLKSALAAVLLAFLPLIGAAHAGGLAPPSGKPVLTVSGAISVTNAPEGAVFDLAMLQAMPKAEFHTKTIWTDGDTTFTGVRLKDLLAAVGASGKTLHAIALNDYAVEIPVSDATADGPIVAYAVDGHALPVRNRGPLWIVYPYDAKVEYRSEVVYSRSIWQLNRIEVRN